jgi:hypothetical protein
LEEEDVQELERLGPSPSVPTQGEDAGVGFELISPVLAGAAGERRLMEVFFALRHMGVQAPNSAGMHVHVNVNRGEHPGEYLSGKQIASIYVAYTKYQLVIDEFLQVSRPSNDYAHRHFVGQCPAKISQKTAVERYTCRAVKRYLRQMHKFLQQNKNDGDYHQAFCNAALAAPDDEAPCEPERPSGAPSGPRYFQLNLVPMISLGTIEFRGFGATHDVERALRWIHFVLAFVEHFGSDLSEWEAFAAGADDDPDKALVELAQKQANATAAELFGAMGNHLEEGTKVYLSERTWWKHIGKDRCGVAADVPPGSAGPRTT